MNAFLAFLKIDLKLALRNRAVLFFNYLFPLMFFFIFAYAFTWIPYIRNLMIHSRHEEAHLDCPDCGKSWAPPSNFCSECGARLAVPSLKASR